MKIADRKNQKAEAESKFPSHIPYEEGKDPILSIRNIDITFGRGRKMFKAVSDASFDIYKGETVSLVGESGSGKTTIGRAIVRINPCSAGAIYYKGTRISGKLKVNKENLAHLVARRDELQELYNQKKAELKEIEAKESINPKRPESYSEAYKTKLAEFDRAEKDLFHAKREVKIAHHPRKEIVRQIQMIFQDPAASLNERATIEYSVSEGLYNFHLYDSEADRVAKIENIITEVGLLPEHLTRYPHEFSGGQRQRVGIARSVVMEPEFIVADEPISALDVSIRAQVLNLLRKFQKERGLTYLFIAHDLSIVRFISDRIAVIHHGKIVEIAETEELFAYPLHPYTKSLLSAIPIPDPILERNKELYVYDPKIHDYEFEKPSLVDIGNGHMVYGNEKEIESYKAVRFAQK